MNEHTHTTTKNYYFLLKLLLCDNHHADHEDDMHNITAKKKTRHDIHILLFKYIEHLIAFCQHDVFHVEQLLAITIIALRFLPLC